LALCSVQSSGHKPLQPQTFLINFSVKFVDVNYSGLSLFFHSPQEPETQKTMIRTQLYACSPLHSSSGNTNGHVVQTKLDTSENMRESCLSMFVNCLKGSTKYKSMRSRNKTGPVSVSKIDSMSRIIFPFVFTCLNVLYWAGFIYYF
jgi:hypothetical protein